MYSKKIFGSFIFCPHLPQFSFCFLRVFEYCIEMIKRSCCLDIHFKCVCSLFFWIFQIFYHFPQKKLKLKTIKLCFVEKSEFQISAFEFFFCNLKLHHSYFLLKKYFSWNITVKTQIWKKKKITLSLANAPNINTANNIHLIILIMSFSCWGNVFFFSHTCHVKNLGLYLLFFLWGNSPKHSIPPQAENFWGESFCSLFFCKMFLAFFLFQLLEGKLCGF